MTVSSFHLYSRPAVHIILFSVLHIAWITLLSKVVSTLCVDRRKMVKSGVVQSRFLHGSLCLGVSIKFRSWSHLEVSKIKEKRSRNKVTARKNVGYWKISYLVLVVLKDSDWNLSQKSQELAEKNATVQSRSCQSLPLLLLQNKTELDNLLFFY